MTELIKKETMTSLDIAEVTGMRHADVMRSIRNMEDAWQKVSQRSFALSSYKQAQPNGGYKNVPCYVLNKTECLYIATKFNDEARAKLVLRWEELEAKERNQYQVPQSFAEALMLAAKQQERIEQQAKQLEKNSKEIIALNGAVAEMKPKVTYVDMILSSKETVTTTQIGQDYGMSATKFNVLLRNFGIHIRSVASGYCTQSIFHVVTCSQKRTLSDTRMERWEQPCTQSGRRKDGCSFTRS